MTEEEWLKSTDPNAVIQFAERNVDSARFRWLLKHWGLRIQSYFEHEERQWFDGYLVWLDGEAPFPTSIPDPLDFDVLDRPYSHIGFARWCIVYLRDAKFGESAYQAALSAGAANPMLIDFLQRRHQNKVEGQQEQKSLNQTLEVTHEQRWFEEKRYKANVQREFCDHVRDIVGNPFRPVNFLPEWRSETVLGLARGIDLDEAFDRMPILADALQDAGCDVEQVLKHCREETTHLRGCWVLAHILEEAAWPGQTPC